MAQPQNNVSGPTTRYRHQQLQALQRQQQPDMPPPSPNNDDVSYEIEIDCFLNMELSSILTKFDPEKVPEPSDWYSNFELFCKLKKWTDAEATQFLPLWLTNTATDWYHGLPEDVKNDKGQLKKTLLKVASRLIILLCGPCSTAWDREINAWTSPLKHMLRTCSTLRENLKRVTKHFYNGTKAPN